MAKKTNSAAKTRAWNRFAQWVKVSKCIQTTGYPFVGVCITCKKRFHIRALQAGHAKGGRTNAILFHEGLTNPQCVICNERHHGRYKRYLRNLIEKHGKEKVEQWFQEASEVKNNRDMDFHAIEVKYRKLTNKLLEPFGYSDYEDMLRGKNER